MTVISEIFNWLCLLFTLGWSSPHTHTHIHPSSAVLISGRMLRPEHLDVLWLTGTHLFKLGAETYYSILGLLAVQMPSLPC